MQTALVIEAIERLTVERGEKRGSYYYATFACKEVLEYMDFEVTKVNLKHVMYIATKGYPGSAVVAGAQSNERTLNMKIRSK